MESRLSANYEDWNYQRLKVCLAVTGYACMSLRAVLTTIRLFPTDPRNRSPSKTPLKTIFFWRRQNL
jgi:hypothetical protein